MRPLGESLERPGPASATGRFRVPDHVPESWGAADPAPGRDLALDMIRGLCILLLVLNHTAITSAIEYGGKTVFSGAEVLVAVSGVVSGIVFGRRWLVFGARRTSALLLRRSGQLYLAALGVIVIVAALRPVSFLNTEALAISPTMDEPVDMYAYDGFGELLIGMVSLEAGPWQINILGFFVAAMAIAPALLWAFNRGLWAPVVALSWVAFHFGREHNYDILPFQSERPFPFLVWQLLFVHGVLFGFYRRRILAALGRVRTLLVRLAVVVAIVAALALIAGQIAVGPAGWERFEDAHYDKGDLSLLRIGVLMAMAVALYAGFSRFREPLSRTLAPALLPLGQSSLYVFVMHAFWCLAVASIPVLASGGLGLLGNSLVEVAGLALLWLAVSRRFLFGVIPR